MLLEMTFLFVQFSVKAVFVTWQLRVIPIKTVQVGVEQMSQVTGCQQLKDQVLMHVILLLMEARAASYLKNLKSTKYL
jgi:hypothetical protein